MTSSDVMANIITAVQYGLADMALLSGFLTLGLQHDVRRKTSGYLSKFPARYSAHLDPAAAPRVCERDGVI